MKNPPSVARLSVSAWQRLGIHRQSVAYLGCRRLLDDGEMSRAVRALRQAVAVETVLRLALRHVGCWGHVRAASHT